MRFTIAAIQLKPKLGDIAYNSRHAFDIVSNVFLKRSEQAHPDLVILPELALTGYNFTSSKYILPFLENFHEGCKVHNFEKCPSINWAINVSKTFKCFTVIGYPEIYKAPGTTVAEEATQASTSILSNDNETFTEKVKGLFNAAKSEDDETSNGTIYNSSCLISPTGSIIFNYRKSFLYSTDEVWGANENPNGFEAFDFNINKDYYSELEELKSNSSDVEKHKLEINIAKRYSDYNIKACMGICMDLSNYKFEAPFEKFEFSTFCFENDIDLILFPMAWLSPASPSLHKEGDGTFKATKVSFFSKFLDNFDSTTLDEVVYNDSQKVNDTIGKEKVEDIDGYDKNKTDMSTVDYWILRCVPLYNSYYKVMRKLPSNTKNHHVVFCNRVGLETDVVYAGSTSIIKFSNLPVESALAKPQYEQQTALEGFRWLDSKNSSVKVYGSLPTGVEGALIRDIDIDLTSH